MKEKEKTRERERLKTVGKGFYESIKEDGKRKKGDKSRASKTNRKLFSFSYSLFIRDFNFILISIINWRKDAEITSQKWKNTNFALNSEKRLMVQ